MFLFPRGFVVYLILRVTLFPCHLHGIFLQTREATLFALASVSEQLLEAEVRQYLSFYFSRGVLPLVVKRV